jgi:mannose-1-phosphate guanylyltransferase
MTLSSLADANLIHCDDSVALGASGNYIHAPGKFVAVVGVEGLVVVDTGDALLVTTLAQAQDVGKVVKLLDGKKLSKLT